ncbi:hypothetical protein BKA62DRAFT_670188 [Auriculariales sp. MPI-PUGE-AT-0066]|nr:hypothetical protein BKA62DRAFT_670188 [Auriculariales sp. MPI-PUGE-AT-0066]
MDFYLTSSDACNADYLDAQTLALVMRVSSQERKKSLVSSLTTTICSFRPAEAQAKLATSTPLAVNSYQLQPAPQVVSPSQQQVYTYGTTTYAASPYGQPQAAPYVQPHPPSYVQPQTTTPVPSPTGGLNGPGAVCEIEWHSVKEDIFTWADGRPKMKADAFVDSSGFWKRSRKFKARSGRSYIWREDGSLLDAETGKEQLGQFANNKKNLREKWDLNSSRAVQWSAVLTLNPTVVPDLEDIVVVLAYLMGKIQESSERSDNIKKVNQTMGAVGGLGG